MTSQNREKRTYVYAEDDSIEASTDYEAARQRHATVYDAVAGKQNQPLPIPIHTWPVKLQKRGHTRNTTGELTNTNNQAEYPSSSPRTPPRAAATRLSRASTT